MATKKQTVITSQTANDEQAANTSAKSGLKPVSLANLSGPKKELAKVQAKIAEFDIDSTGNTDTLFGQICTGLLTMRSENRTDEEVSNALLAIAPVMIGHKDLRKMGLDIGFTEVKATLARANKSRAASSKILDDGRLDAAKDNRAAAKLQLAKLDEDYRAASAKRSEADRLYKEAVNLVKGLTGTDNTEASKIRLEAAQAKLAEAKKLLETSKANELVARKAAGK